MRRQRIVDELCLVEVLLELWGPQALFDTLDLCCDAVHV